MSTWVYLRTRKSNFGHELALRRYTMWQTAELIFLSGSPHLHWRNIPRNQLLTVLPNPHRPRLRRKLMILKVWTPPRIDPPVTCIELMKGYCTDRHVFSSHSLVFTTSSTICIRLHSWHEHEASTFIYTQWVELFHKTARFFVQPLLRDTGKTRKFNWMRDDTSPDIRLTSTTPLWMFFFTSTSMEVLASCKKSTSR